MTATIRLPTRRIGSLEVPVVGLVELHHLIVGEVAKLHLIGGAAFLLFLVDARKDGAGRVAALVDVLNRERIHRHSRAIAMPHGSSPT